jgi:hypothetical protein
MLLGESTVQHRRQILDGVPDGSLAGDSLTMIPYLPSDGCCLPSDGCCTISIKVWYHKSPKYSPHLSSIYIYRQINMHVLCFFITVFVA